MGSASARATDAPASPAHFDAWVSREPSAQSRFPASWSSRSDLPLGTQTQIAALVHVYYPALWDELVDHLAAIPIAFDLIVTNASGVALAIDGERIPAALHSVVLDVENRGRDLWPLAQVVNAGLIDSYDVVVKVHTKRSEWRDAHGRLGGTGRSWRRQLLSDLLGDSSNVAGILEAFASTPDLGMVTADGSVLGPEHWGDNELVAATLLKRLGLEPDRDALTFAAGSMYWTRGAILRDLRALDLSAADFEDEAGQVNVTTAHALERVIGLMARQAGLRIVERSHLRVARS